MIDSRNRDNDEDFEKRYFEVKLIRQKKKTTTFLIKLKKKIIL